MRAVTASDTGKIAFIAGPLALNINGLRVRIGHMRAQMELTFRNLDQCLKTAGVTWAAVANANGHVTDFAELEKCAGVRMRG